MLARLHDLCLRATRRMAAPVRAVDAPDQSVVGLDFGNLTAAEKRDRGRAYLRTFPKLLPANDSLEAFAAWMLSIGEDPAAPGAMDIYADVCDLGGWSVPWDDLPVAPQKPDLMMRKALPAPVRSPLSAPAAADLFVHWIRDTGRCGTYPSAELSRLYAAHCRECDLDEVAESSLREAIKKMPGVSVAMADVKGSGSRRRVRSMHYSIADLVPVPVIERLAA